MIFSENIKNHVFSVADLNVDGRLPGISAFMRVRNGADFIEKTIDSHIAHFDEIVVLYNQCNDNTPEILARLANKYGTKLRVFHYLDRVYPPGSKGHRETPGNSPNSLVNYCNVALSKTRFSVATKLDDDHLGIPEMLEKTVLKIRGLSCRLDAFLGFSGINLIRNSAGEIAIPLGDPISGNGDIGFFEVTDKTMFIHDRRFERFQRGGYKRRFTGYLYWHLKFLKDGMGFNNYEIEDNPESRYVKRRKAALESTVNSIGLKELQRLRRPRYWHAPKLLLWDKERFRRERHRGLAVFDKYDSLAEAIEQTTGVTDLTSLLTPGLRA